MIPDSSEKADPTPAGPVTGPVTGTVTGPVTARELQVGRWAVLGAQAVLVLGVGLAAVTAFLPATPPIWALPAALVVALAALVGLSRGDPSARSVPGRLRSGLIRALRPEPVPVPPTATASRTTRVERFELVERTGTRLTCEFLGPRRKGAPEPGDIAEIHGRTRPDGTLRVTRVVHAVDGSEFRPRPDLGFALARLATGAGTAAGAALLLASLALMTVRNL